MQTKWHAGDWAIASLAARQRGVIAAWQLARLGLGPGAIKHRVKTGRLIRTHHGVYAVGHRMLSWQGVMMAAVLACGPDAVLSHRSAARLWGIRPDNRSRVDVTVPGTGRRRRRGIDVHVTRHLDPRDRTVIDGIPVTSLERTFLDLAEIVPTDHVARTIEEAARKRIFDLSAVNELLARSRGRRGQRPLRSIIAAAAIEPATRRELERVFQKVLREANLPKAKINTLVEGFEVDAVWPEQRLVVELDGYETHGTRQAFENDRARDAVLVLAGYRVIRVTWRQLTREPQRVTRMLTALLVPGETAPPADCTSAL